MKLPWIWRERWFKTVWKNEFLTLKHQHPNDVIFNWNFTTSQRARTTAFSALSHAATWRGLLTTVCTLKTVFFVTQCASRVRARHRRICIWNDGGGGDGDDSLSRLGKCSFPLYVYCRTFTARGNLAAPATFTVAVAVCLVVQVNARELEAKVVLTGRQALGGD